MEVLEVWEVSNLPRLSRLPTLSGLKYRNGKNRTFARTIIGRVLCQLSYVAFIVFWIFSHAHLWRGIALDGEF
jgi:hypothetical protein